MPALLLVINIPVWLGDRGREIRTYPDAVECIVAPRCAIDRAVKENCLGRLNISVWTVVTTSPFPIVVHNIIWDDRGRFHIFGNEYALTGVRLLLFPSDAF